VNRFCG